MTNNSDRLDRIEAALERTETIVESNTRNIDILVGIARGQQQHITTMLEEIRDIKTEIRGLQTENRRLFQRLFPEENQE